MCLLIKGLLIGTITVSKLKVDPWFALKMVNQCSMASCHGVRVVQEEVHLVFMPTSMPPCLGFWTLSDVINLNKILFNELMHLLKNDRFLFSI